MKRPAFQFYPADWRKDVELHSCSMAAQGLWVNIMCVAHECEPYGHLTVNGKAMTTPQLARHVGLGAKECQVLLDELFENGVPRRTANGVIYCKRMVEDEDLRIRRANGGHAGAEHGIKGAEHGAKGGRPPKSRGDTKPPLEPPPSSSSSSSSSNTEIQGSVCVNGIPEPTHTHHAVPPEYRDRARTSRPDLNPDAVWQDFCGHYTPDKRTANRWDKWLAREEAPGSTGPNGTGVDPDSKGAVTALGIELGLGQWDELKEPFPAYKARVRQVQFQTSRGA